MSESAATVRRLPFLSVPAWDLSDEELGEWQRTPGMRLAAFTAECIRDGRYDNGREIYPPGSGVHAELSRAAVERVMGILAERGMVRKSGSAWYAVTPGRLEPSVRRAVTVLLDRRADLPAALAAELDAWKVTLDALAAAADGTVQASTVQASAGASAGQTAVVRAVRPAGPVRAIAAG
jgi:hypothetical protein